MKLDKKIIEEYVNLNLITKRKCDFANLWILNYTPETVYECKWNNLTKSSRGLIINSNYEIIKRPFEKFFNFSELSKNDLDNIKKLNEFEVWEKLDGSLGILYNVNNKNYIATRGSFNSDQAKIGTKILNEKYSNINFNENYTYLFEIISPETKVVIDYNNIEDLFLIGVIETKTGNEINILEEAKKLGLKTAKYFGKYTFNDIDELINRNTKNEEGYVIKFKNNYRVKLKFEDYFKLHKIITGATDKNLLELMSDGINLKNYFVNLPEEYRDELMKKAEYYQNKYNEIFNYCYNYTFKIANFINRKTIYLYLIEEEPLYKDIIINMLYTGKSGFKSSIRKIWNIIKEGEKDDRKNKEII